MGCLKLPYEIKAQGLKNYAFLAGERLGNFWVEPKKCNRAYEYHLKDHLGNTRLTFTTNPKEVEFKLNYESSTTDPDDETLFSDLNNIITANVHDYVHPDETFNHTEVQLLNGAAGGVVGSVLTFAVGAGDKISAEVYAKYLAPTGTNNPAAAVGNLVISAIAGGTVPGNYDGAITSGYGPGGTVTGLINTNASSTEPMAFINLLFLPDDVTGSIATDHFAFKQITPASSNSQALLAFDQPFEAPQAGYVVVYLSNESEQLTEVYFDDLKVTINEHPVIQMDDYYPFGLTHAGGFNRVTAKKNDYLYNGKERITDLGLNWDDYGARMYMPDIGRWGVVDPKAESYESGSPYSYAFDNPIRFIDIQGEDPGDVVVIFDGADLSSLLPPGNGQRLANGININGGNVRSFVGQFWTTGQRQVYNRQQGHSQTTTFTKRINPSNTKELNAATQAAYDYIKESRENNDDGRVIIYGYSWGGVLANHLAKRLKEDNVDVDFLITVDAANGDRSDDLNRTVSDNVKRVDNYFNPDGSSNILGSHGQEAQAEDESKTEVNNKLTISFTDPEGKKQKVTHSNIDEATFNDILKSINDYLRFSNE